MRQGAKTTMWRVVAVAAGMGATAPGVASAQSREDVALPALPTPTTRVEAAPGSRVDVITPSGTVQVQCPATNLDEPKATTCPPLAPQPPTTVTPTVQTVSESYAGSVLVADGVAVLALVGGISARSDRALGLSLATYLLGAPIVHFAHGEVWRGVGSATLRIASPIMLGLTGFALGGGGTKSSNQIPSAIFGGLGLIGGIITASVVDAAFLANHQVKREVEAVRVIPQVSVTGTGAEAGVVGTF